MNPVASSGDHRAVGARHVERYEAYRVPIRIRIIAEQRGDQHLGAIRPTTLDRIDSSQGRRIDRLIRAEGVRRPEEISVPCKLSDDGVSPGGQRWGGMARHATRKGRWCASVGSIDLELDESRRRARARRDRAQCEREGNSVARQRRILEELTRPMVLALAIVSVPPTNTIV